MEIEACNNTYDRFRLCKNIDELWGQLHSILNVYGVTSIFYGFTYSASLAKSKGATQAVWFKSSHPAEYLDYFDEKFNIEDDLTAFHCISETTPFVWHDKTLWAGATDSQLKFMQDSEMFGMDVGVTLPFHFNQHGVGGMGLCAANLSTDEFDTLWKNNKDKIVCIANTFDNVLRNEHMNYIYLLTVEEIDTLTYLSLGYPVKAIGSKIGVSQSRATQYARSARTKLNSNNNEQAVCKALVLGLINP